MTWLQLLSKIEDLIEEGKVNQFDEVDLSMIENEVNEDEN